MSRKAVPTATQTMVLVRSKRRCCVCFHLDDDDLQKEGQIAHIDGDNENCDLSNLAWLCPIHHDALDSSRSQLKGLTEGEVLFARETLYAHFGTVPSEETEVSVFVDRGDAPQELIGRLYLDLHLLAMSANAKSIRLVVGDRVTIDKEK